VTAPVSAGVFVALAVTVNVAKSACEFGGVGLQLNVGAHGDDDVQLDVPVN